MKNAKMDLVKAEYEIDRLTAEFHKLAEQNQELDYDIPSQQDIILKNLARMEIIEARLRGYEVLAQVEDSAKRAARAAVNHLSPVSLNLIRRRHLTLVWSKE